MGPKSRSWGVGGLGWRGDLILAKLHAQLSEHAQGLPGVEGSREQSFDIDCSPAVAWLQLIISASVYELSQGAAIAAAADEAAIQEERDMTVPTYDKFIEPILRYLALHPEGATAPAAHEAAAKQLSLSEEDRALILPSGTQRIYKNRAGWAHDRLKRAGLSSSPKHGFWRITPAGLEFAKNNPQPLPDALVQKLAVEYLGVILKPASGESQSTAKSATSPSGGSHLPATTPDDQLDVALGELRQAAIDELLERLASVSPSFFETLVLDVLHRMGYGASRTDLVQTGGPGDAGVDGVINLDRLGLEKVYVQAKRWQQAISRPELQAFFGALAGQKAKKGIFITTSTFTNQAKDFAKSVEGMVLIDGPRLAGLMIEYEVGVSSRAIRIPKVDSDYFDEDVI